MSAHTPGPWAAEWVSDSGGENPVDVWEVVSSDGFSRVAEHLSAENARLIAAAPELLAALQEAERIRRAEMVLADGMDDAGNSYTAAQRQDAQLFLSTRRANWYFSARAAIAKATKGAR